MSNASRNGLIAFVLMIIAAWFFCGMLPTTIMPNNGIAMALPVIQVPGEVYFEGWPSEDFEFTNTLMGLILTDIVVVLFILAASMASGGWAKEVPGRFQSIAELLVGAIYGLSKNMAGTAKIVRDWLFPLTASIFFFLLIANWMELIPGVDSVGIMHCGKANEHNGYGRNGNMLFNEDTLFVGYAVEEEVQYEMCELYLLNQLNGPFPVEVTADDEVTIAAHIDELHHKAEELHDEDPHHAHLYELEAHAWELHIEAYHEFEAFEAEMEAAGITHDTIAEIEAKVEEGEELSAEEQEVLDMEEHLALLETQVRYPEALFALTDEQMEQGIEPYGFIVTPYVRAAATDMNLTFGLAIISIIAIQVFGVAALGPGYFMKFVNIKALGNVPKKPMGLMDFGVGLFEIVSEFAKMISLSFRLFGNIFAGQLLLFIITFLVATLLPAAVYGLEFAVGLIQALVFGMLTLVFSAQAMVSHDHDDHEHGHDH